MMADFPHRTPKGRCCSSSHSLSRAFNIYVVTYIIVAHTLWPPGPWIVAGSPVRWLVGAQIAVRSVSLPRSYIAIASIQLLQRAQYLQFFFHIIPANFCGEKNNYHFFSIQLTFFFLKITIFIKLKSVTSFKNYRLLLDLKVF